MALNSAPTGERIYIGFFGKRNAGKSSVVNAFTSQELSVVSDYAGTTTDPVYKAMELLPMGAVTVIDTPGYDDVGELGKLRVKKTMEALNRVDVAVLVVDAVKGLAEDDKRMVESFNKRRLPYIVAYNKADLEGASGGSDGILVSALKNTNIHELRERVAHLSADAVKQKVIVSDMIKAGDVVVLVTPIDASAPKGRLILPQQQTLRDILDGDATAFVCKEDALKSTLENLAKPPALVITDSQVFAEVAKIVPEDVPLTSFSILMARYKGFLHTAVEGVKAIDELKDGDIVLISEGCTHHRQCEDIGTVKIPNWLKRHTGKDIRFETTSGREFPEDLSRYSLIIHCGGCMLNEREVTYRMNCAIAAGIPFTNYGTAIARMKGILQRSLSIFEN